MGVFVHQLHSACPVVVFWKVSLEATSPCSHSIGSPMTPPIAAFRSANPNENVGVWPGRHQPVGGELGYHNVLAVAKLTAVMSPKKSANPLSSRASMALPAGAPESAAR
jgi:hypothetical protein